MKLLALVFVVASVGAAAVPLYVRESSGGRDIDKRDDYNNWPGSTNVYNEGNGGTAYVSNNYGSSWGGGGGGGGGGAGGGGAGAGGEGGGGWP